MTMDAIATTDVIRLTEARAAHPATSGSKAATLAVLTSRGFPVPPGFVVTTVACDRILASVDPVAGDLAAAELPADVWAGIVAGLSWLGGDAVAVRSSGTAEDLAGASYAGQYEPVLGAKGPDPGRARRRCCHSATSRRTTRDRRWNRWRREAGRRKGHHGRSVSGNLRSRSSRAEGPTYIAARV